ncbi:MAG: hypothetical protein ABI240_14080 [Sphingomonas sp.]
MACIVAGSRSGFAEAKCRANSRWPRSGKIAAFPEVDAARWMGLPQAREMMLESQQPLLDRPLERLGEANS